ncbi:MAG TPA: aspartate--tRNA ligase [Gordonia sp. (in: high G+C Gram-positive bacteria)]|uniref:aspartate--tRNA ligase n=3 Tax=unclassified Gordonia (in: high G+C Gram-positive bacteria) TaxID=2657482 RepID=UPI000FA9D209|nr:aspartate--tRNA ligase [Gordonia sp. (in: high G+C Gram-positive bacteria)]RUP35613.1 MAG: aspartate--tRNA ligase [Gordonia sp. (in: high G+C Gram-positive bacteria)]HNP57742.1 aspartate--tRNA ligase [Gordonia sp. (in: high G+C Gram-positive bacteria)]HRC50432.1 aspartate--tRNA ligase [Gordonia sp. (in: high G+C Gram-positive bacteria)]
MLRTHLAGSLRRDTAGQTVTVAGWVARRRDHGGVVFIDLRDASGVVQVVFRDEAVAAAAHRLRAEFVIAVTGVVELRPEGSENANLASGAIEISAAQLEVLNESAPLPFQLDEQPGEEVRLRHRYLDLRREGPAAAIRLRSRANAAARGVLAAHDFIEIETPTLTRSTPEGARDFLVPARLQPGTFYALPQSPQLFKQLLMVAGMERYYQIARAYRDEDFRADRQPEFTQLDIEMSFVEQDDVIALAEEILVALWRLIGVELTTPIPRITYAEAMRRYGSDKPDLRFEIELVECTDFFADTPFRVFQAPYVGAVVMSGGASQPRRTLDGWQEWAKQRGAKGLAYVLVNEDGTLGGPVAKNLSDDERAGLAGHVGAKPGDCVFFAAGPANAQRALLGAARSEIATRLGLIPGPDDVVDPSTADWAFTWVVDAPLFEPVDDAAAAGDVAVGSGAWTAVHHAFTSPKPESVDALETDPGAALAYAYDIVCNGNEIGGGSIRIHRRDVQERVFAIMGIDHDEAQEKFGFLLDAFAFGAPPHGGIAFGWDRIAALLAGESSIREVIAFPKSGGGVDPLTAAPAPITAAQRKESGIDAKPKAAADEAKVPADQQQAWRTRICW